MTSLMSENLFTESENRKRKIWLRILLGLAILDTFVLFFDLDKHIHADKIRTTSEVWASFAILIFSVLKSLLPTYILYHCAYKKMGSKYLTFFLLINPLAVLKELLVELKQGEQGIFDFLYFAVFTLFYAWWLYLGWSVRKMNKRIRKAAKEVPCLN